MQLHVLSGPDRGSVFTIDGRRCTVGRDRACDIALSDTSVAGSHCAISAHPDGYRLRALEPEAPVRVGDLRVLEAYLNSGAVVRVGDTDLRFEILDASAHGIESTRARFHGMVGASSAMRAVFDQLDKVAPSELTCMLLGETGVGKERLARAIHRASGRRDGPFVVLDCGSLPAQIIESTLFGHEKGAFTGAVNQHRGCFEQARAGTIFLDEIGELDIALQPKLLRVLEQRQITRMGGSRTIEIDVRVIAATHRDLRAEVEAGNFRDDLYYRLSVVRLEIPPLRDRREDIPIIAEQFLDAAARARGILLSFTDDAIAALQGHHWPGNVRELRNVVQRAGALCDGPAVSRAELAFAERATLANSNAADRAISIPLDQPFKRAKGEVVRAFEARYLQELLERNGGNISRSAREAGLTRYHLRELLKRHELTA